MKTLEEDLRECLSIINSDWNTQNNILDKQTNFIYQCNTLKECLDLIDKQNVDKEYALHRWFNYMTSIKCEDIFCEYGAVHDNNIYNHNVDIYIKGIPFDVKLTVYPAKLYQHPYNLKTRKGKNQMINWYYLNQSQESRKQLINRIYVVCDGSSQKERLELKCNFSIIRDKIKKFIDYTTKNGFNTVYITDNNKEYKIYSDIIYITT